MKKLLGLLLACFISFSAVAQTTPAQLSQATSDLKYGADIMDANVVQTALDQGADPHVVEVYGDYYCYDILALVVSRADWKYREGHDQVMQIVRLLVEHGADMTKHNCSESALEVALYNVAKLGGDRCSSEMYKSVFDVLDLMLSLTDSSKALSTVSPEIIERVIRGAGFKHPELFRYLLDKGLRVQSRYIKVARQRVEDELKLGLAVGSYQEVADLLQQAYEEQSPEFIKEVVKRNLQIREQCPALRKQF